MWKNEENVSPDDTALNAWALVEEGELPACSFASAP